MHEGKVLCGQDRSADPGPEDGPACRRCTKIWKNGGRRPPQVYKQHYFYFEREGDRIVGGIICEAIGHPGNADDVPVCMSAIAVLPHPCKRCAHLIKTFFPTMMGEPVEQRALQVERIAQIDAAYKKVGGIVNSVVFGGMSLREGTLRAETVLINEI